MSVEEELKVQQQEIRRGRRRFLGAGATVGVAAIATPAIIACAEKLADSRVSRGEEAPVPGADEETELLFVQSARGASLADGRLRLVDVSSSTLYFSDRPQHLAGHWGTRDFLSNWDTGGGQSFETVPPNASLSVMSASDPQNVIVELTRPRLDGRDLVYDARVLEGPDALSGEGAALFIDTLGHPLSPGSVTGVHRRHRRRRLRHEVRD